MPVVFEDYSIRIKESLRNIAVAFLYEASDEILARTARNYDIAGRVRTGRTKGSFQRKVDSESLIVYMGSNAENAIWEEYGTGEFAEKGDGRKTPWKYFDAYLGEWFTTTGKTGHKPFYTVYITSKNAIIKEAERRFSE